MSRSAGGRTSATTRSFGGTAWSSWAGRSHALGLTSVCLVGGVDSKGKPANNFTEQQLYSLYQYVKALELTLGHEVAVVGHRDLDPGKACPSFEVRNWVEQWRPLSSSEPLPGQQPAGRPEPESSTDSS